MKVFEYEVDVFDEYEIGLTAAVRKAYALHGGPVVEEFTFVSFPPNSDEAVRTTFSYTDLNLQQALFVEVAAMLHHLNVKLGHLEAP